jgi:hypothetical protein
VIPTPSQMRTYKVGGTSIKGKFRSPGTVPKYNLDSTENKKANDRNNSSANRSRRRKRGDRLINSNTRKTEKDAEKPKPEQIYEPYKYSMSLKHTNERVSLPANLPKRGIGRPNMIDEDTANKNLLQEFHETECPMPAPIPERFTPIDEEKLISQIKNSPK